MFLLFYHNEKTIGDNMRERTGIQLCYPFEERRILDPKFGWIWPVLVQPKLDGERMRALCSGILHDPLLLSSTESNIVSVPHIKKELSELRTFMEFDGELYQHGADFNKIQSKVGRSVYLHSEHEEISYHVFDIISDQMQINRTTILERFFSDREFQYLKLVPSELCYDMNQIMDIYKKYLSEGYEGIIIRHIHAKYERKRSRFIMKFKPKKTDIYQIVEIIEGTGDHAGPGNTLLPISPVKSGKEPGGLSPRLHLGQLYILGMQEIRNFYIFTLLYSCFPKIYCAPEAHPDSYRGKNSRHRIFRPS